MSLIVLSRCIFTRKMAKARRARRRVSARRIRARPYKFTSSKRVLGRSVFASNCPKVMEKNEWEDAVCSVCMECPHNAVLLLCSSHDKGCRPYMCGTSFRYSNCLDQYKKASAKLMPSHQQPIDSKSELSNLKCPLCRGQVKGWTIVQPARDDLNLKRRSCMQETCSFAGTFKELRKHMKKDHPCAQPREVDPDVEQKWRRFEVEQERNDAFGASGNNNTRRSDTTTGLASDTSHELASDANELVINQSDVESSGPEEDGAMSLANRIRSQRRVLLGRSVSRRRRDREANQNSDHPR
ncbi:unnamed protein product [Thlaspi arvense]|uniref:Uncharacterized protein n=1 Tax=Thlaspi arvense TaxID=13288 RepID=A0AAU9R541_THLAR|nr:unnamed protein product [Thlaspi arvense]